ncbi:autotransporter outer membrane beta-barrel domain-containing protein [soil metagenome]
MRYLLACTAMAPVLMALTTGEGRAETTIGTETKTPILTSTVKSGQPDSILISAAGSVIVTSGSAVTMDSNHAINSAGKISLTGASNANGIRALAGTSGDITNSGTITLDEDYTATDTDKDGDIDGAFAQGSNRNAILIGADHVGNILHSGTITIEGNQSAGIRSDGPLTGKLTTSGTTTVLGDGSYGIRAGAITGDVWLRGTTNVQGKDSAGVALLGDINGALKIQSMIASTGYRSTTPPTDVTKLDADDLLQGGPALKISGNVTGGILFDTPPADLDTAKPDEDNDGVADASEGSASVVSYGSAAAVEIGATDRATAIGAVAGNTSGYGLIVQGSVTGSGVYAGVDANGMTIGGLGGAVTIAKGMSVGGGIGATSLDSNATALRIGSGASVNQIAIGGTLSATGAALAGKTARALVIDSGASVAGISNTGVISATARTDKGAAIAILDSAGTVTALENKGKISATGGAAGQNIAIDLRANASGTTISQSAVSATSAIPAITGDIYTGSGNDLLKVTGGTIAGNVALGAGDDGVQLSDKAAMTGNLAYGGGSAALSLAGTSSLKGNVDFGGGAGTLTIADNALFSGQLIKSGNINVTLASGTLDATNGGTLALASLNAGAKSTIAVAIDGAAGTHTLYDVSGAASFAAGAQVKLKLARIGGSEGSFTFLQAGSLSGAPVISDDAALLPFLYKGTVAANAAAGTLTVDIRRKTATELGLNGSQSRAYDAIYAVLDKDAGVAQSILSIGDGDSLRASMGQMLPDHAGGTFEAVTGGSRATARILADPGGTARTDRTMSVWLQQVAWGGSKSLGDTASYDINGWGTSGGLEFQTGLGKFGGSLAYLHGTDSDGGNSNGVSSDQYEAAAHWRAGWGHLQTYARLSAAQIRFKGARRFSGLTGLADVNRAAKANWDGQLYSAAAGASYQMAFGRFSLRPIAAIDYYRLKEDGYAETGGGDAFNLTVNGRTSDELTASGSVAAGYDLGSLDAENGWLRVELEGGRRQIVGGSIGDTTAHFKDGKDFTLVAEDRTNGWTGKARLLGGSDIFRMAGEFSAEEQQDHVALAFRASLSFPM